MAHSLSTGSDTIVMHFQPNGSMEVGFEAAQAWNILPSSWRGNPDSLGVRIPSAFDNYGGTREQPQIDSLARDLLTGLQTGRDTLHSLNLVLGVAPTPTSYVSIDSVGEVYDCSFLSFRMRDHTISKQRRGEPGIDLIPLKRPVARPDCVVEPLPKTPGYYSFRINQ